MTFSDFVSSLGYGINLFLDSLYLVAENLIHNYIVITLLGLVLFSSLLFFLVDIFTDIFSFHVKNNIDDYLDGYRNFDRFQRMKFSWYNNNRELVYNSKIDSVMISKNAHSIVNDILYDSNNNYVSRHKYKDKYNSSDVPEWFYTTPKNEPLSLAEEKELTDIINNF